MRNRFRGVGVCYVFRDYRRSTRISSPGARDGSLIGEQIHQRLRLLRPTGFAFRSTIVIPSCSRRVGKRSSISAGFHVPRSSTGSKDLRASPDHDQSGGPALCRKNTAKSRSTKPAMRRARTCSSISRPGNSKSVAPPLPGSRTSSVDIKAFFGHYAGACDEARELLFAPAIPMKSKLLSASWNSAGSMPRRGTYDSSLPPRSAPRDSPHLHRMRRPPLRRPSAGRSHQVARLHREYSPYLHFDDFDGKACPNSSPA